MSVKPNSTPAESLSGKDCTQRPPDIPLGGNNIINEDLGTYIIEIDHISKWFGDKQVLDDVSLFVKKGEFVTILGPSGCGKTTLLRILAGLTMTDKGSVRMNGRDITEIPPHKRPTNTVFQRYALFPHLNVYDNIAFGLKLKKTPQEEIEKQVRRVLKIVGLTDYEERDVESLSGGQQQRVAIARAIVNKPQVLLLDEPLAALDLKMRQDMQMELKQMHKQLGITFIYVTHDQEEALTLSDTIVVMNKGKVQQIGTPTDIYNEPVNPFVADFIGDSNILNGIMKSDFHVQTMYQDFECVDKGFAPDERVDVVIRPEDIYIMQRNDSAQIKGVVQSCIFKGVHYEMAVLTEKGYELLIQDYNAFEAGSEVSLIIKPNDFHVMHKEQNINVLKGVVENSNHVSFLGGSFECLPHGLETGTEVSVRLTDRKIELMDYTDEGGAAGCVSFILYKGNHYQLTVTADNGDEIQVYTNEVWDDGDIVGIRILPEDIIITPLKEKE
ncbi:MAG: polyamine ABC transporter ATP-binding protein [Bacteroidaceae bacterium]|nr:polyamine ABC transporter ATP-binding protein [Bacteroidaceae bacterium]